MSWPTPQDYNEAIQNPATSFQDAELMTGSTQLNALGLPRAMTGAFASVYRIKCEKRDWAVRCFLHNIKDQDERYAELSHFIRDDDLVYTVGFNYFPDGIRVGSEWFPILKMEWVDGTSLDQYLLQYVHNSSLVEGLLAKFIEMERRLNEAGIAHGDLQHGNILVFEDELRLVDYDGMFVPALAGLKSNELGHPNYQHRKRTPRHFGPYLDHFSTWVIYTSLFCLVRDRDLWMQLNGGDECLLFRQSDYRNPLSSYSFSQLESHRLPEIRRMAGVLKALCSYPVKQIPRLDPSVKDIKDLPPIDESIEDPDEQTEEEASDNGGGKSMRLSRLTNLPDWMKNEDKTASDKMPTRIVGPWPQFRHYQEAVQKCGESFSDPELTNAAHLVNRFGKGPNGAVFYLRCMTREIAVKCFFYHAKERQERYEELSRALVGPAQRFFAEFEYQPEGIKVGNYWYPILKMEWQRGFNLNQCAEYYAGDKVALVKVRDQFRLMMRTLHQAGIAHTDLNPTNILITGSELKLIDYDNMYVPAFSGRRSIELGEPHYQHPSRSLSHFDSYVDNYPAWIIDTLLTFMIVDRDLYDLVRKRFEYTGPDATWPFKFLELHNHYEVRERVSLLKRFIKMPIEDVPPLDPEYVPPKSPGWMSSMFKRPPKKQKQPDENR